MISQAEWEKACEEFAEREQKRRDNAKCKTCFDSGVIIVGYSGLESDGNAPEFEECEDCHV